LPLGGTGYSNAQHAQEQFGDVRWRNFVRHGLGQKIGNQRERDEASSEISVSSISTIRQRPLDTRASEAGEDMNITPELNQKWVHLKSEHEDIKLLRTKLEKAEKRVQQLSDEIKDMCQAAA
jgi:hypothetical protein